MKMGVIYILFLVSFGIISYGQENIIVESASLITYKGNHPAFKVNIYQAKRNDVLKSWEKTLRKGTKSKFISENNEFSIDSAIIQRITDVPLNVYSTLVEYNWGVTLNVAFELDSTFIDSINSTPDIYFAAKNFVREFAVSEYTNAVKEELRQEEKKHRELNIELEKLINKNVDFNKNIVKNEQDILNTEEDIQALTLESENKSKEIEDQKITITKVQNSPERLKEAKKVLKSIERDKKGIINTIENQHKKIVSYKDEIEKMKREIELNVENQRLKQEEIITQSQKVLTVKNKLENIR